jgi:hypothetical protein
MSIEDLAVTLPNIRPLSRNNDVPSDGSTGGLLPPWAEALVRMGFAFAGAMELLEQSNASVAVCLPRIEFAALFMAFGVIKWKACRASPKQGLQRLRALLGTWVSYEHNGVTKVGRLDHVPENGDGYVKILDFKGKKVPNFGDMSLEERKRYIPPKSAGLWHLVESEWWATIKPVGREFDEQRGARAHQVARIASAARDSSIVEKLIGSGGEFWLMTSQEKPICMFGCKSRLDEELQEDIPLMKNFGRLKLSPILRPAGSEEYAASSHISVGTCRKMQCVDPESICIIEGGRLLEDNLLTSSGNNRVVLLARNTPSYEEAAQIVKNAFLHRIKEFSVNCVKLPLHIKVLSFIHK